MLSLKWCLLLLLPWMTKILFRGVVPLSPRMARTLVPRRTALGHQSCIDARTLSHHARPSGTDPRASTHGPCRTTHGPRARTVVHRRTALGHGPSCIDARPSGTDLRASTHGSCRTMHGRRASTHGPRAPRLGPSAREFSTLGY